MPMPGKRFLAALSMMAAATLPPFVTARAATDHSATPDAAHIARAGNDHGATACMACHGNRGEGRAAAGFPRLAGLDATYLLKQLGDFADGSRKNAVMQPIARALSRPERKAMADYYAALPPPATKASGKAVPSAQVPGARLALRGRWKEQLPACVQCHGPHGAGVGAHFPPLAGQPAAYLANQLHAWQDGTRHNDPLALMQNVSAKLSDQDIQAVSAWFSAQPATEPGDAP